MQQHIRGFMQVASECMAMAKRRNMIPDTFCLKRKYDETPMPFIPQTTFLGLIGAGDGYCVASRGRRLHLA